jgi:hypothetical protein
MFKTEIYPNPASNTLKIEVNKTLISTNYFIFDMLGRSILYGKINSENTSVDISSLNKGIYMLCLEKKSKNLLKIIKK